MNSLELRCVDCNKIVEPIRELDQSLDPDDPPTYNLICPKCGFHVGNAPNRNKSE